MLASPVRPLHAHAGSMFREGSPGGSASRIRLDGRGVDFTLCKGLGLLAYLADARTPVGRESHGGPAVARRQRGRSARQIAAHTLRKIHLAFTVARGPRARQGFSLAAITAAQ